ncbi:TraR/DksA family transcriptional regulator [Candidatus Amarolinea aalborgensis]|jgi:RNA polymerase-binding transcription factor DksA|uniref:TraR/DksA family transcriptional regulator n=1 Tax=Candidatus Amarolinea aalborgensis TaxID=2249329 RepID=UPI003BFA3362
MNRDDLVDRERIKLEAERTEIEAKIQHLGEWLKGEVDIDAEEGDPDLFEREKNLALLNTLERRLEQTVSALRAIDKGLYGICERCGQPIDPARLEVKPDATLCLKCQQEVERLVRRGIAPTQIDWER